jgi:hypothetical protein
MSDNGPNSRDGAINQANAENKTGSGPAQTHNWNSEARNAYETQRSWNEAQSKKSS